MIHAIALPRLAFGERSSNIHWACVRSNRTPEATWHGSAAIVRGT